MRINKKSQLNKRDIAPGLIIANRTYSSAWLCLSVKIDNSRHQDVYVVQYMTIKSSSQKMFSLHQTIYKIPKEQKHVQFSEEIVRIVP